MFMKYLTSEYPSRFPFSRKRKTLSVFSKNLQCFSYPSPHLPLIHSFIKASFLFRAVLSPYKNVRRTIFCLCLDKLSTLIFNKSVRKSQQPLSLHFVYPSKVYSMKMLNILQKIPSNKVFVSLLYLCRFLQDPIYSLKKM